jgi:hypothetical protein
VDVNAYNTKQQGVQARLQQQQQQQQQYNYASAGNTELTVLRFHVILRAGVVNRYRKDTRFEYTWSALWCVVCGAEC